MSLNTECPCKECICLPVCCNNYKKIYRKGNTYIGKFLYEYNCSTLEKFIGTNRTSAPINRRLTHNILLRIQQK